MSSQEAGAVGDYAGKINLGNVESQNRASTYDAMNRSRVDMFNKQTNIAEAEANAANRAAWQSRISGNLANMGTMFGQKARDDKMYDMQEKTQQDWMKINQGYLDILGGMAPGVSPMMYTQQPPVVPINPDVMADLEAMKWLYKNTLPAPYSFSRGGNLSHRLRMLKRKPI
ncbi:MAG: hypothetical protein HC875_29560 [Anaerolineales bacterium]|nr:hypothetical protein [Anaerolineales bacterium]